MFKSNNKLKLKAKIMTMVYGIVLHNSDLSSVLPELLMSVRTLHCNIVATLVQIVTCPKLLP